MGVRISNKKAIKGFATLRSTLQLHFRGDKILSNSNMSALSIMILVSCFLVTRAMNLPSDTGPLFLMFFLLALYQALLKIKKELRVASKL